MARTLHSFTGIGSRSTYPVNFGLGFISREHVYVYTGDLTGYNTQLSYTWSNSNTIELSAPLPSGQVMYIRRVVPRDKLINDYEDGAILRESNLDASFAQALMILEEIQDGFFIPNGFGNVTFDGNNDYNIMLSGYTYTKSEIDNFLNNLDIGSNVNAGNVKFVGTVDYIANNVEDALEQEYLLRKSNTDRLSAVEGSVVTNNQSIGTINSELAIVMNRLLVVENRSLSNTIDISSLSNSKISKDVSATAGNIPVFTADGSVADSGATLDDAISSSPDYIQEELPVGVIKDGARWYVPSEATTYIYYVDVDGGQWVEEAVQSAEGTLRDELAEPTSTVIVGGVKARNLADELSSAIRFGATYNGVIDNTTAETDYLDNLLSKNPEPSQRGGRVGLPKNSIFDLGQVKLWQGAGGVWDTGSNNNLSLGQLSMEDNTTGYANTAMGYETLTFNTEGFNNTALGKGALKFNTTGSENTAVGVNALLNNTTAAENTAVGRSALEQNTTGQDNTANGYKALQTNTASSGHTAVGNNAGTQINGGANSVAVGYRAMLCETTLTGSPTRCVAVGFEALRRNDTSAENTAIGAQAMVENLTGNQNTAIGSNSLKNQTNQSNNTAVGYQALEQILGGSNTAIGANALRTSGSLFRNNCTAIGANAEVTANNQVQLGDSSTTVYAYGAVQDRSDARDKTDIKDIDSRLIDFFYDVEFKTFRMDYREDYKEVTDTGEVVFHEKDGSKARKRHHVGVIAQQVEEAARKNNVDFAGLKHHVYDGEGDDVYSVGYQEFVGIMGKIIQNQEKRISELERIVGESN